MRNLIVQPDAIRHQGRLIVYEVAHRKRVTRRLHLELNDRGRLRVVAPRRLSRRDIHETLQRSADYVARFLDDARARRAREPRLRYVDGEKHLLLGRHYPLEIRVDPDARKALRWMSDRIRLVFPERPDADAVRALLLNGYRELALEDFAVRLRETGARAPWVRRKMPALRVRRMKASWGTCSADGIITLNPLLMRAQARCIDYVVAHEVCHLREHNHSPKFYELQDALYPGWQRVRRHLNEHGQRYLQI
jgi:hypothetical protein